MTRRPPCFGSDQRAQKLTTPWYLYIIPIGAAALYVGAQVYLEMQADVSPVRAETYCGGCGIAITEAGGIAPLVAILLLVGIVLVSRAWMVGGVGTENTDEAE